MNPEPSAKRRKFRRETLRLEQQIDATLSLTQFEMN